MRKISLTPYGISTNQVLDYLISDILTVATDEFISEEANGSSIRPFLDV